MKQIKGDLEKKIQFGVLPMGTAERKLKERMNGILLINK